MLQLQWGRDQLIAELHLHKRILRVLARLQWGRDQLIAELRIGEVPIFGFVDASMGPRSADRGIHS